MLFLCEVGYGQKCDSSCCLLAGGCALAVNRCGLANQPLVGGGVVEGGEE